MADRSIYCTACHRYLGVIRDAKLHKDIHHLCDNCNTMRIASDMGKKTAPSDAFRNIFGDVFDDVLGDKGKKGGFFR